MRKPLVALLAVLGLCHALAAQQMDGDRFHNLTMGFTTPHQDWAEKLPQGKLKALYVVSLSQARAVVEAAQRADVTLDAVTTNLRFRGLGITADSDAYYGILYNGTSDTAKAQELLNKLATPYEVIAVSGPEMRAIPARCLLRMLQQVKRGSGLVLFGVHGATERLRKILTKKTMLPDARREILSLAGGPTRKALGLTAYRFGKGRIVVAGCKLYASPHDYRSPRWWADHENAQVLLVRTLLWAAGRQPTVRIACPPLEADAVLMQQVEQVPLSVTTDKTGQLALRLRDEFNKVVHTTHLAFSGSQIVQYALPKLPGGRYYLDVMAKVGDVTGNFGYYAFRMDSPVKAELVNPDDAVKGFSPIRATLKLNRPLPGGTARLSLIDSPYERVWYRRRIKLAPGVATPIEVTGYHMPTLAAFLRVDVMQGDEVLCAADTTYYFPVYNQKLPTYAEIFWEYNPGGPDRLRSMAECDVMGYCGVCNRIDDDRPPVQHYMLLNQRLMAHMTCPGMRKTGKNGAFLFSALGGHYKRTLADKDEKHLEATTSYSLGNPGSAKVDRLLVQADCRNKDLSRYPLAVYGMGNEVRTPYKSGFAPDDNKAFAAMLKARYGTIAKLNAEWGRRYASFEKVPHLKMPDALRDKRFPEWLAHRRFVNLTVLTRVRNIVAELRRHDPNARPGCDGVWTRNPGFNMEDVLAIQEIGFWGLYNRLTDAEVLRSLRPDIEIGHYWGWILPNHTYPEAPWFNLLVGTAKHSSWFISGATVGGTQLSADYRPYRPDTTAQMEKLRTGLAQLLITTPLKLDGMAIWENYACNVACQLGDPRYIQTTDSSLPLIALGYQKGINFDFVAWRGMAKKLAKYKVLFLCGASAISEYQRQQMLTYVKNGGTIVADLSPGVMNDSYGPVPGGRLPELFGRFPDNVPAPVLGPVKVNTKLNGRAIKLVSEAPVTPGIAPFTVRRYGKGHAVLLNFPLANAKLSAKGDTFDRFMLDLLAACGVAPTVKVTGLPDESIVRVRQGRGFHLMGLMNRRLAVGGRDGGAVTVTFPKAGTIYEPGKGRVARGRTVTCTFAPPFKLFAIFPTPQQPPTLRLSSTTARPGTPITLDLSPFAPGRVLLVQIRDAGGHLIRPRSEAVVHEVFEVDPRQKTRPIYFAYNAPKGTYKLTLTAVVTGLASQASIDLK